MSFRLLPKSVTLNDLERRNSQPPRNFTEFGSFRDGHDMEVFMYLLRSSQCSFLYFTFAISSADEFLVGECCPHYCVITVVPIPVQPSPQTIRAVEQLIFCSCWLFSCVGGQRHRRVLNVLLLNTGLQMLPLQNFTVEWCLTIDAKRTSLLMTVV